MRTTIVVSPRERFSSIVPTLQSLFGTIAPDIPVVVVEGATPAPVRRKLEQLRQQRPFEHVALPYMVTPNEARNIGGRMAETEFVVFADNDIEFEAGWLEALETNADAHDSVAVAPLIFIGPHDPLRIHHAGGLLTFNTLSGGKQVLTEAHRLMNVAFDTVADVLAEKAPVTNDVCEFHCMLMRRSFFEAMGGLDERLITREQVDFALRVKAAGERATFAEDSRVTYRAYDPFDPIDLRYHLFRWSDERAVESIAAFEDTWKVELPRDSIRFNWIERHRDRAISTAYPRIQRLLGRKRMRTLVSNRLENRIRRTDQRGRTHAPPRSVPTVASLPTARELIPIHE